MLKWFSVPIMDIQLYIIFLFTDNKSFQKSPFCHLVYVRITWYLLIGFYNPSFIKVWSDHRGNQKQYIEGQTIVVYMWLQSSIWRGSDHCACVTGSDITGSDVSQVTGNDVTGSDVFFRFLALFSYYSSSTKCNTVSTSTMATGKWPKVTWPRRVPLEGWRACMRNRK